MCQPREKPICERAATGSASFDAAARITGLPHWSFGSSVEAPTGMSSDDCCRWRHCACRFLLGAGNVVSQKGTFFAADMRIAEPVSTTPAPIPSPVVFGWSVTNSGCLLPRRRLSCINVDAGKESHDSRRSAQ